MYVSNILKILHKCKQEQERRVMANAWYIYTMLLATAPCPAHVKWSVFNKLTYNAHK